MSTVQPIVPDVGSLELTLTRLQVNQLVLFVEGLQAAVAVATDFASLQVAVAAVSAATLEQIIATIEPPLPPLFPKTTATP